MAASNDQAIAGGFNYLAEGKLQLFDPFRHGTPNNQTERSERRVGIWPRLKSTHAPLDLKCIKRPIDQSVFAFQNRRERRFRIVLRLRLDVIEIVYRFADRSEEHTS